MTSHRLPPPPHATAHAYANAELDRLVAAIRADIAEMIANPAAPTPEHAYLYRQQWIKQGIDTGALPSAYIACLLAAALDRISRT